MLDRAGQMPPERIEVEVFLHRHLVEEATKLGVDVSEACERALRDAIASAKGARWYKENREFVDYWNRYVEEHGLPLARYRQF